MINSIQLIKESFTTYKVNFKKIFWTALPIFVLSIISNYYSNTFINMADNENFSNISKLITSLIIFFIAILVTSLYLDPVLNRAIQKKEDGQEFDSAAAYTFQNKNLFKWIAVNIWGFLYLVFRILPYIIVSFLVFVISYFTDILTFSNLPIILLISLLIIIVGVILNITRFMLYKNIFFSKDEVSARNAVRESIELGKSKKGQIWILILTLIVFSLLLSLLSFVVGFIIGLFGSIFNETIFYYLSIILDSAILSLISIPLMYIFIAKVYVKVR